MGVEPAETELMDRLHVMANGAAIATLVQVTNAARFGLIAQVRHGNDSMTRKVLLVAMISALVSQHVLAEDGVSVVKQSHSEPGVSGELFVFIGEQLSYEPLDLSCDRCWVFDSWHTARYRVAKWIHGVAPADELEFSVAEHAVRVPFGHSRYALVFVEQVGDARTLVKYQQVPVYPTTDDGFASCGPLGGGPDDPSEALDPEGPALREIDFLPRLVVDDARRLSAVGRKRAYDPRWYAIEGDEVVCRRGVPLEDLVAAKVSQHEMLRAALPELAGAAR
jgi:hypothetical protein